MGQAKQRGTHKERVAAALSVTLCKLDRLYAEIEALRLEFRLAWQLMPAKAFGHIDDNFTKMGIGAASAWGAYLIDASAHGGWQPTFDRIFPGNPETPHKLRAATTRRDALIASYRP